MASERTGCRGIRGGAGTRRHLSHSHGRGAQLIEVEGALDEEPEPVAGTAWARASIVLFLTAAFLLARFFAPRNGLIAKTWRRRRPATTEQSDAAELDTETAPEPVNTGALS